MLLTLSLALLFVIVFAASLMPAFGPPSWIFVVFFREHYGLNYIAVILTAALATALGRVVLAKTAGRLGRRLSKKQNKHLKHARKYLQKRRGQAMVLIAVFLLSPLPSAQLFEAAGLMKLPMLPIGFGFFLGRLLTYNIYLGAAVATGVSLENIWGAGLASGWSVLTEIVMLGAIGALMQYGIPKFRKHYA